MYVILFLWQTSMWMYVILFLPSTVYDFIVWCLLGLLLDNKAKGLGSRKKLWVAKIAEITVQSINIFI